jgi:cell division protein FtsN
MRLRKCKSTVNRFQTRLKLKSIFIMVTMNKQRGGTILGLMVGVVLGLAAALAVAVFVTKTPSPFNNKGQAHTTESDATESKKNKDWDPNSTLYGKNPAKPTQPVIPGIASAPTTPAAAATAPAVAVDPLPAMPKEKPAKAPPKQPSPAAADGSEPVVTPPVVAGSLGPSVAIGGAGAPKPAPKPNVTDPLGDLLKSKNDPKSSNSSAEPFIYFVQAGAFRTPEDAEAQRARLSLAGVETRVSEREQAGRTVYRVRSGPFNKEDDADRMKDRISATGADAALVRVQR